MDILLTILIAIIVLIAIFLALALFIRKDYVIEREIRIQKSSREVYDYVRCLRNQDHFSKWVMLDPNMRKTFTGTDGSVGFIYLWDSDNKNAGKGEQEIKGLKQDELVDVEVRFEKPFKTVARAPFILESMGTGETKVRWGMRGRYQYPMNFMNLFVDKLLGKDLETSLATLKNILEKR